MKRIKEYLQKILGSENNEESVKSRRKFAIILTSALVVALGTILSALFLNGSNDAISTTDVLSGNIVSREELNDEPDEIGEESTNAKGQTVTKGTSGASAKKTTTTAAGKSGRTKGTTRATTTYKRYDKAFMITADTNADPYIENIATAKSYDTRDISDERYTVRNIDTGEEVTSDGFDILCQVVNGEMGPSFSSEALKAQAVAAYTYMIYCENIGQTPELGLDDDYSEKIESAVRAVEGLILTYGGEPINAVFSASSAGVTASSKNAWGENLPYLRSVESKYDKNDSNYGEKSKKIIQEVEMKLKYQLGVNLTNDPAKWMSITKTYDGRYVKEVTFCDGQKVTGEFIKALFNLKSNAFTISYKTGVGFTFTTYGYGHGVGMSQEGADLYAIKDGLKFDQILKHYYSGVSIKLSGSEDTEPTTEASKSKTTTAKTTTKKATTTNKATTTKKTSKTTTKNTTPKPGTTQNNSEPTVTTPSVTSPEYEPPIEEPQSPTEDPGEYEPPEETQPPQSEPGDDYEPEQPPEQGEQEQDWQDWQEW